MKNHHVKHITQALNRYRFTGNWYLAAPPEVVFTVLSEVGEFPLWRPQVRSVRRIRDDTAELTCRSVLPYTLRFRITRREQSAHTGTLRAWLTGDLAGTMDWRVVAEHDGCRVSYQQEVIVGKQLLRFLAPIARIVLRANHHYMMRAGRHGMRIYVAGRISRD